MINGNGGCPKTYEGNHLTPIIRELEFTRYAWDPFC